MENPENLRSSPRAPLKLRVEYARLNSFFADYTKNLSKGGTFIKTPRPFGIGTKCTFAFTLPNLEEPLHIEGEVTWSMPEEKAQERNEDPGMGVRFLFKDDAEQRAFGELVERMMEESLGADVARGLLGK